MKAIKSIFVTVTVAACILMTCPVSFAGSGSTLCVSGILSGAGRMTAVINGMVLEEGQAVSRDISVFKITSSSVWFKRGKELFARKLGGDCAVGQDSIVKYQPPPQSTPSKKAVFSQTEQTAQMYSRAAISFYEKALDEHARAKFMAAGIYYRKAVRYAQESLTGVRGSQREVLEKIISDYRRKKDVLGVALEEVEKTQLPRLDSARSIAQWLREHIEYRPDWNAHSEEDYWQSPRETVILGVGDCEDFAFLAQDLLASIGVYSQVIGIEYVEDSKLMGHAICVFPQGSPNRYFNCASLIAAPGRSIKDIVARLYPSWVRISELDIRTHSSRLLYQNDFSKKGS